MDDLLQYEVTVLVDDDFIAAWEAYLPGHVVEVLATGCFESGEIERAEAGVYRCRYHVASRELLARYLTDHAPRLRADVAVHFPDGIESSRAVWTRWQRLEP